MIKKKPPQRPIEIKEPEDTWVFFSHCEKKEKQEFKAWNHQWWLENKRKGGFEKKEKKREEKKPFNDYRDIKDNINGFDQDEISCWCPNCGSQPQFYTNHRGWRAGCPVCMLSGPVRSERKLAARAWNKHFDA